jgi:hypothetical protein
MGAEEDRPRGRPRAAPPVNAPEPGAALVKVVLLSCRSLLKFIAGPVVFVVLSFYFRVGRELEGLLYLAVFPV